MAVNRRSETAATDRKAEAICGGNGRLYSFASVKRWWPILIIVLLLLVGVVALQIDWNWKRKLSPRGGRPFFTRVELASAVVPAIR